MPTTKKKAATKKAPARIKVRQVDASGDTKHSPVQVSVAGADVYYANEARRREAEAKRK